MHFLIAIKSKISFFSERYVLIFETMNTCFPLESNVTDYIVNCWKQLTNRYCIDSDIVQNNTPLLSKSISATFPDISSVSKFLPPKWKVGTFIFTVDLEKLKSKTVRQILIDK